MRSSWILITFIGFITRLKVGMLSVPAADVQHVRLGSNIILSCNISYIHHTTWLKHNPGLPPTVVLCARLSGGQAVQVFQLGPRYSVSLIHRSLGLRIAEVEEGDLGLYYCAATEKTCLVVGGGVTLQGPPVESSWFHFCHWHCVGVGSGLLILVVTVCFVHCKFKPKRKKNTHSCCSH